jgi:aconitate decarboxylase
MYPYTRRLADFAFDLRFGDIPKDVIDHLKLCILDTLGCGIFGSTTQWGMILWDYIHASDKNEESTIWGTPFRSSASNAALVNGTMVHGFELDDLHSMAPSHPGSVVVTSALATAEHKGKVNGKDFLTAVAIGYELLIRLAYCCGFSMFKRGLHSTGACGTVGSAAASAKILELDKEKMLNALAISATSPSGLICAQYGAMVKRLFAGKAAQTGVVGAELASRGFTGSKDVLEAEFGGFFSALCGNDDDLTKLTVKLGKEYKIKGVGFKKYPCVGTNLSALDAVREIMDKNAFNVESIKRIRVKVNDFIKAHSGWKYKPEGIMSAQMNMYYCIAIMLIEGDCSVDQFLEGKLSDPQVLKLVKLIDVLVDPQMNKLPITKRWASTVEIDLKTGKRFSLRVDYPRGSVKNPMSYEEIKEKFRKLAQKKISIAKANSIIATVERLEELKDIGELAGLLIP